MFVDKAKILIKAGDGGNGAVSFHREKYVAAGGPDGGDGGKGGDIVFVVDDNMSTLVDFRYKRKFVAEDGEPGGMKNCSGRAGKDLVIKVPKGTLVRDELSGKLIADLSSEREVIIAKGGGGGAGNQHFATSTRQIPRFAKPGVVGDEFELMLELKLLADVGLVGFPNVGKSTLISVVSEAKPVIANYHFTTITPVLGVVKFDDWNNFIMADIPGLIEGASQGVGLGHDFLRHVERCRIILHVVDVSGIEGRDPIDDFEKINIELANFSDDLALRPQIVAGNKSDMATREQLDTFKKYVEDKGYPFFEISAVTTQGTTELIQFVAARLAELPPIKEFTPELVPELEAMKRKNQKITFKITVVDGVYVIDAPLLENIMSTVDMEDYESLQYFQRVLRSSGIIDKLERMGIQEGDTVNILGFEFDFIN
ncbi:MAG: GTPase ObgE [Oscillospiraceae bacterium]